MNKKRKAYSKSCEISELKKVSLGGYEQKILIEGKSRNNPVVICLHGGPGSPVPFGVGCRGLFPEWTDRAVMVYWDQLGCGCNNYKIDDRFCIRSFTDMTADLISFIKREFPHNRIYLFAMSWGSVLSLRAAIESAELLDGVVVYGQIVKGLFFNDEVYSAFASAPKKVQKRIAQIRADGIACGDKQLDKNLYDMAKYLRKYTDGYVHRSAKKVAAGKMIKGLLTSPDYTFGDFKAIVKNGYRGNVSIWRELLSLDLSGDFAKVNVPYLILQGDSDLVTSTNTAVQTMEACGNQNVRLKTLRQSGHNPSQTAMEETYRELFFMAEQTGTKE